MTGFDAAAAAFAERHGPARLRTLATSIDAGQRPAAVVAGQPADVAAHARALLDAWRSDGGLDRCGAAAYLRGVADGYEHRAANLSVEAVWSGPSSHAVPVRATAQVLIDVVGEATRELTLVTYSAKPYQPLLDALTDAAGRGVHISIVVETLQGAGNALAGTEPAAAFAGVPKVELWHWPTTEREEPSAKMHAKLAVADQRVLLVSSANLTQSGVAKNIEAGLLVRGGAAPRRATEHLAELRASATLTRLSVGGQ